MCIETCLPIPISDGNRRMTRLLSLLLLYQEGDEVGRYISLEKATENTKEAYNDSLNAFSHRCLDQSLHYK